MRAVSPGSVLWVASLVFILSALPLWAETEGAPEKFNLAFRGSIFIFPEDNGLASDTGGIHPSAGVAAGFPLFKRLSLELSLDFYGGYYAYNLGRAVPANPENRSSFVIGSILGVQALVLFPLSDTMRLRVYGGPAADLRICLVAGGLEGEDKKAASQETKDIAAYFWGQARWFIPVIGAGMDFDVTQKIRLGFDARIWMPIYRLWTGESLPGIEGWRFGLGFRFSLI